MTATRPFEDIPLVQFPPDFFERLPEVVVEAYQQHGPIFRTVSPWGNDMVNLVGPEANKLVLVSGRQKFSHAIGWGQMFGINNLLGRGLLTMDGAEHAHHRKMMNPAFTLAYMERYLPLMQSVVRRRVAEWAAQGEVDIYQEMRKITFDIAAEALTGLDAGEEVDRFRRIFVGLLNGPEDQSAIQTEEDWLAFIQPLRIELASLLIPKIEARRR